MQQDASNQYSMKPAFQALFVITWNSSLLLLIWYRWWLIAFVLGIFSIASGIALHQAWRSPRWRRRVWVVGSDVSENPPGLKAGLIGSFIMAALCFCWAWAEYK